jgi:hypothetical protein
MIKKLTREENWCCHRLFQFMEQMKENRLAETNAGITSWDFEATRQLCL